MIILAKEIAQNLPMRVKSLDGSGMFHGEIIRFHKVNKAGHLLGDVVGKKGRSICVISPVKQFETIHGGE